MTSTTTTATTATTTTTTTTTTTIIIIIPTIHGDISMDLLVEHRCVGCESRDIVLIYDLLFALIFGTSGGVNCYQKRAAQYKYF